MKKQFVEGIIKNCKREKCECPCCDNDRVEEWEFEYFAFHDRIKDYLKSKGIKIKFKGDRIEFKNCSDGKNCKFLKHSTNRNIDLRPIDCKIYPFVVDWNTIDFDKKIVNLFFWDRTCPLVRKNKIPKEFKKEVETIIKRDFSLLFHGAYFQVKFINKNHKHLS